MKKILLISFLLINLCKGNGNIISLSVPGEDTRNINLDEKDEGLQHKSFKKIINKLKEEGKNLLLAETVSQDEKGIKYYQYYDASPDNLYFEYFTKNPAAHDPITRLPIIKTYYYNYNPITKKIELIRSPFIKKRISKNHETLEDILQELRPDLTTRTYLPEKEKLNLSNLDLQDHDIPEDFFIRLAHQLPHLRYLNLSNNKLQSVPESISYLTNLEELYLANNQLLTLPATLGELKNLHTISATNNRLQSIHETIFSLPHLEWLNVSDNPHLIIPDENKRKLENRGARVVAF